MWVTIYKSPKIGDKREFMDPLDKYKRVQKILENYFYWATHHMFSRRANSKFFDQIVDCFDENIFCETMW